MSIIRLIKTSLGSFLFKRYTQFKHGLTFRVATQADMDALYRFRFEVYTGEGYVNPDDYPDKQFSDQYDPFSISVITLKENRIIGCGRAIRWSELGLPVFQFFSIKLPVDIEPESIVEMGLFMVDPAYRGKARLATLGMSMELRSFVRSDSSKKWLIAFMSNKVRDAFHEIVPFEILDEYPPEQKHLEARTIRQGYWDKGVIHPVIAESSQLL